MKNNIFHIESEEKKRIISLHENSTKKQYLIQEEPSTLYGTPNIATPSSGIKLDFKTVQDVENNALINKDLKELMKIRVKCQNSQYTGSVDESKVNEKLDYFVDNFWKRYSWFSDEQLKTVSDNIKSLGNMPTFCKLNEKFKSENSGKSDLLIRFYKSVMSSDSLFKYMINPLKDLEKTKESSGTKNIWTDSVDKFFGKIKNRFVKFPCVPNTRLGGTYEMSKDHNKLQYRWKSSEDDDVTYVYYDTGAYFIDEDGEEKPTESNAYYKYTCVGGMLTPSRTLVDINGNPYDSSKSTETGSVKWRSLGSLYDKEILQALGKSGDKLTDDDIRDIYNKLKIS